MIVAQVLQGGKHRQLRQRTLPRALAIDADGDVWLGNWFDAGFFEIDPNLGKVKRWVYMGINPYGAVIDSRGILWAPYRGYRGQVRGFNTNNFRIPTDNTEGAMLRAVITAFNELIRKCTQSWGDRGNYGIAVDGKDRVYLGSYGQNNQLPPNTTPANNSWKKLGLSSSAVAGTQVQVWDVASRLVPMASCGLSNRPETTVVSPGMIRKSLNIVHDLYLRFARRYPNGRHRVVTNLITNAR